MSILLSQLKEVNIFMNYRILRKQEVENQGWNTSIASFIAAATG